MRIVFFSTNLKETHFYIEDFLVKNYKNVLIIKEKKISLIKIFSFWIKFFIRFYKWIKNYFLGNSFYFPKLPIFKNTKNFIYFKKSIENQIFKKVINFNPDIILLYTNIIIPKQIYLQFLSINLHTGITPFYKGKDTTEWALYENNYYFTGYTIMRITEGLDQGNIIKIKQVYPFSKEGYSDFKYRLHFLASESLLETLNRNFNEYENYKLKKFKNYKSFNKNKELKNIFNSKNYSNFLTINNFKKNTFNSNNDKEEIKKGLYIIDLDLDQKLLNSFINKYLSFIQNNFNSIDFNIKKENSNLSSKRKSQVIFITSNSENQLSNKVNNFIQDNLIHLNVLNKNSNVFYNSKYKIYYIKRKNNHFDFLDIIEVIKKNNNNIIILEFLGINKTSKKNFLHIIKIDKFNYKNFKNDLSYYPIID